ncbi:MAG: phosphoglucosamine mutase [Verrucomicrobia bacterium]|jgi:phosphoglucosamine mutase|nr:phosphoglucosamine mutase [Verrucomicrobiota bacterium]MBT7067698.1 phosphoglucosamine mutase [Verrucomicrobiota bacterium]MBT7701551.1 phosphoglucosamine mutase [Verrucomicrobiota bacterium]
MTKLFGTDGIRGIANVAPMTVESALAIGRATAYICRRHDKRHRIVIGKDTRLSGYMIENALTAGICSMGVDVLLLGPLPTPGIAFTTCSMRADAGIVISASHNPYQDNGIKIFSGTGFKLSDEDEAEIEMLVSTGKINDIRPTAAEVGRATRIDDAIGRYIVFCKNTFPSDMDLEGMKIVLDCANGATYKVAPIIFQELGAEVIAIHNKPNGRNINDACGSQFTDDLKAAVLEHGADLGLAFDGDGDRLIAVDETATEVTGDFLLAICARGMQQAGELKNDKVVITCMSNVGLRQAFDGMGITCPESDVGDRNVLELMIREDAVLGGEQSGHIIFLDHHTTGDGILSALQLVAAMRRPGKPLSELAAVMSQSPQVLINIPVSTKPDLDSLAGYCEAVAAAETELGTAGRVLNRYSGTQAICRVMVEAATDADANRIAGSLAELIRGQIGES